MGEFWRDVKEAQRQEKEEYESRISGDYNFLVKNSQRVGDHHRFEEWDFWWTGTVRNYKTGKRIHFSQLVKLVKEKCLKK